jgi:glycosyltransferase involved in cell wall biosynthesis
VRHVVQLIPTIDRIGGAERQVILLAKGLVKRDWQVTVVALSGTGEDTANQLVMAGINYLSLGMHHGLVDTNGWIRFHRWLRQTRPDVLHAHLPHAAFLMRWSRLGAPVRVALNTIHTSATGPTGRILGYRYSNWLVDQVTTVSNAVADAYVSARVVTERRLTVVPNGVDLKEWRPDPAVRKLVRQELGLAEDEFLWFAAGRLEPVKDYPALLNALAQVPGRARLVIAGGGPLEDALRHQAATLGIGEKVQFLGFVPTVRRWMQAADGFVLSSRWEGLPMGLLEASACAVPAVATDVPGSWAIVVHGQSGLLAHAGDVNALAAAMARLMQMTEEERTAMGQLAQRQAEERYDIDRVLDRWEELYAELLERNPAPRRWGSMR